MAKTERIELRLDSKLVERIDNWANETGKASSRSDAIRQLLDIGLGIVTGKSIHLTDGDKLNFMMLREIIKHLEIKSPEIDVDLIAKSILRGHYWAPAWIASSLFDKDTDKPEDVSLVFDTLYMWDLIERRIKELTREEQEQLKSATYGSLPKFDGFDGNHESKLMGIAQFLVYDMERFPHFKGREFNSHLQNAEYYRRMTEVFKTILPTLVHGKPLSVEQIVEILNSGRAK